MSRRLRAGVIGAGSWAIAAHIPVLARRHEVELVSVCRPGPEALARLTERFGFGVATEDYREALDQDLDIVVVSSPTAFHFEHVSAALDAGAHVLCEKPMTIDPAEAWRLVDHAERADRQLLLSFGWNYSPMIRRAKAMLDEHGIGRLEHVTLHMSSATRELLSNSGSYPDADPASLPEQATWTDPRISGGGYAQAQLTHALGLLFGLFPVRATTVRSLMSSVLNAPVETHAAMIVEFDNGAIGTVSGGSGHVGASANKHELELRAIGSEGQLIIDVHREFAWLFREDGTDIQLDLAEGDGAYRSFGPANALVDVALGHPEENSAPGEVGARTVEALALAYGGVVDTAGLQ
jgi:predicted dehydrogenase